MDSSCVVRDLVFSKEARTVAFIVYRDDSCTVHMPSGETASFDKCERLATDHKGLVVAYKVGHKGKSFVAVNTNSDPEFAWVSDPKVSPDGHTVAYFAERALKLPGIEKHERGLIVNGRIESGHRGSGHIIFTSHDQLVFTLQNKGESFVFLSKDRIGPFEWVLAPVSIPGTDNVLFWARGKQGWQLYRNNLIVDKSEASVSDRGVTWDDNGTKIGYWAKREGQWFIGVNGSVTAALGEPVPFVGGPALGNNGMIGYCARVGSSVFAVVNNKREESYDAISQIAFYPGGDSYAYKAQRNGKEYVVVNGNAGASYEAGYCPVFNEAGTVEHIPVFSPDGRTVACIVGRNGAEYVSVNDSLHGPYTCISGTPVFSRSGRIVFAGARQPGPKEFLVVDEEELGPFERIWGADQQEYYSTFSRPYIDPFSGNIVFAARSEDRLALYKIELEDL